VFCDLVGEVEETFYGNITQLKQGTS
jgi:hypothetical protein